MESGFRKVVRGQYEKRLFHLKGKRNVRCSQVELTHKSLNSGDVFILDDGLTIYAWNGKDSNKTERMKVIMHPLNNFQLFSLCMYLVMRVATEMLSLTSL